MRVLLCLHHRLDPDLGAPGATLLLGAALEEAGCTVEYFSFDHAFGTFPAEDITHQVRFPWHVAYFLSRRADAFDVVDASTGDAWLWAALRRPGGRRPSALITRAHGLEHVADEKVRQAAHRVGPPLSWRYPLYHGGLRLWEVRRSLALSDHCILLNQGDRDYVRDRLGLPQERLSVIPNGIADHFHVAPPPRSVHGPLQLAFVGRWTTYKGKHTLLAAIDLLEQRGIDVSLSVLGSAVDAEVALRDVREGLRNRVSVTPRFSNEHLPELLSGKEVFVFPSLSEGSSASLLEAMACGLAPVATSVGSAPDVIRNGIDGVLVEVDDAVGIAEALERLAADRGALLAMRERAQRIARRHRWKVIAARTLRLYEAVLEASVERLRRRSHRRQGVLAAERFRKLIQVEVLEGASSSGPRLDQSHEPRAQRSVLLTPRWSGR